MAQISLYNGEIYKRSSLWYAMFGIIVATVILVSFLYAQYATVLLMIFLLGAYIFFSVQQHTLTVVRIDNDGIVFGTYKKLFSQIQGFSLIVDDDTLRTLVFIVDGKVMYFTIPETRSDSDLKNFVEMLYDKIALIQTINEPSINRRRRIRKI
jgi:hypothetical protein